MALTVALLAGQSHAFVLAEEGAGDVPQKEISSEGNQTDAPDNGNAVDGSNVENGDTGNTGNGTEQGGDINDGVDEQKKCVCGTACTEDAVNGECPVCAVDYTACAGKADDTENNATEGDGTENENGNLDGQEQCVCETKCVEDAVNGECPVCVVDYAACVGKADDSDNNALEGDGEILSAEAAALTVDEGVAMMVEESTVVLAVGEEFLDSTGIIYRVIDDSLRQVEVTGHKDSKLIKGAITIPESVEKDGITYSVVGIESTAFYEYSGLTRVTIPDSVTSIGPGAFELCRSLTNVKIPEGVRRIENRTFYGCSSLTSVDIPGSVTSIMDNVFSGCNFSSIEIPEGVTSIAPSTFVGCSSLKSVTISENISMIYTTAFAGCGKLVELCFVVLSDDNIQFPGLGYGKDSFIGLPNERSICFVDKNKKELTGKRYENAKAVFEEAAKNDNDPADNPADGKWYGWSL